VNDDLRAVGASGHIEEELSRDEFGRRPARADSGLPMSNDVFRDYIGPMLGPREHTVLGFQVSRDLRRLFEESNVPTHILIRRLFREGDLARSRLYLASLSRYVTSRVASATPGLDSLRGKYNVDYETVDTFRFNAGSASSLACRTHFMSLMGINRPTRVSNRLEIDCYWEGDGNHYPTVRDRTIPYRPYRRSRDMEIARVLLRPMVPGKADKNTTVTHVGYSNASTTAYSSGGDTSEVLHYIAENVASVRVMALKLRDLGHGYEVSELIAACRNTLQALFIAVSFAMDHAYRRQEEELIDAIVDCPHVATLVLSGRAHLAPFCSWDKNRLPTSVCTLLGRGLLSLTTLSLIDQVANAHRVLYDLLRALEMGAQRRNGLDVARLHRLYYDANDDTVRYDQNEGENSFSRDEYESLSRSFLSEYAHYRVTGSMKPSHVDEMARMSRFLGGLGYLRLSRVLPMHTLYYTPWLSAALANLRELDLGIVMDEDYHPATNMLGRFRDDYYDTTQSLESVNELLLAVFQARAPALRHLWIGGSVLLAMSVRVLHAIHASAPQLETLGVPIVVHDNLAERGTYINLETGNTRWSDIYNFSNLSIAMGVFPSKSAWRDFLHETHGDPFPHLTTLRFFPHADDFPAMSNAMLERLHTLWVAKVHTVDIAVPVIVHEASYMRKYVVEHMQATRGDTMTFEDFLHASLEERAEIMKAATKIYDERYTKEIIERLSAGFEPFFAGLRRAVNVERLYIQHAVMEGMANWRDLMGAIGDSMPKLRELIVHCTRDPRVEFHYRAPFRFQYRALFSLAFGSAFGNEVHRLDDAAFLPGRALDSMPLLPVIDVARAFLAPPPVGVAPIVPRPADPNFVYGHHRLQHLTRLYFCVGDIQSHYLNLEYSSGEDSSVAFAIALFGPASARPFPALRQFDTPYARFEDGLPTGHPLCYFTMPCDMQRPSCTAFGCQRCFGLNAMYT